nr:olfactory receptor 51E1-like [Pelodiscus sinensis]|eukprot:XP_025046031.1 olfactory receptor 51E1-like [Pelodiscus sinensis]
MYIIAILGNFTILIIVKKEPSLYGPMYYFLCMLAINDLILSTCILPKMLAIFWLNSREISFSACLTQLYIIHGFSVMESGLFVAMALDRYVAISKISLAVVLRGGVLVLPYPFLVKRWLYCRTNIIPQPYCTHIGVVNLACGDIRISSYYGLFVQFCVMGLDRFAQNVPLPFHVLIANLSLLMPPMLNPIIYGVKTKEIRGRLLRLFSQKGT